MTIMIFLLVTSFIFIGGLALFVLFFVSRRFSPVPYFPSNHKDIPEIIKLLELRDNQILYDLGAGDGAVILAAARASFARRLTARFIAVEINPVLILIIKLRTLFHPDRKNISVVRGDMFTMNFPPASFHHSSSDIRHSPTFFMYISPWFMEKTVANIVRQYKKVELVTYFYTLPHSKKYKMKLLKSAKNIHPVYKYSLTQ